MQFANRMTDKEVFLTFIGNEEQWEQIEKAWDDAELKEALRKYERALIPKKEWEALKQEKQEINDELIFALAKHKTYYMLSNADQRTRKRDDYKDVQYKLGAYKEGLNNMQRFRPDLYDKLCDEILPKYIENDFNQDFAPTIHRKKQDYEWETIDILPAKEHKVMDNAKMQGAMIFRETETSYNLIGLELFESKKELADRLGMDERLIYKAKPGEVIKIDDIVIQFQDVIKGEPKPLTKDEVMEKLKFWKSRIELYESKGMIEARDRIQRMYDIWENTGRLKGFLDEVKA